MAERPLKRPRDPIQLAKLIGDILTGQVEDKVEDGKSARRKGGIVGGPARAKVLTPEQRAKIAHVAATARWKKAKG